jgi:hypothetical protein
LFLLNTQEEKRTHPKRVIGSKAEYPTKTATRDKLDEIRRNLQREVANQPTANANVIGGQTAFLN